MIGRVQLPDSGSPLLAAPPDRPPTRAAAPRPAGHTFVGVEPSHHSVDIATRVPWQYTGDAGEVTNCRVGVSLHLTSA